MNRVLVSGGGGTIGAAVVRRALHDPVVSTPTADFDAVIAGADVVIVATNHSAYSHPGALRAIAAAAHEDCLVVDPWNALAAGQVFAYVNEMALFAHLKPHASCGGDSLMS